MLEIDSVSDRIQDRKIAEEVEREWLQEEFDQLRKRERDMNDCLPTLTAVLESSSEALLPVGMAPDLLLRLRRLLVLRGGGDRIMVTADGGRFGSPFKGEGDDGGCISMLRSGV